MKKMKVRSSNQDIFYLPKGKEPTSLPPGKIYPRLPLVGEQFLEIQSTGIENSGLVYDPKKSLYTTMVMKICPAGRKRKYKIE